MLMKRLCARFMSATSSKGKSVEGGGYTENLASFAAKFFLLLAIDNKEKKIPMELCLESKAPKKVISLLMEPTEAQIVHAKHMRKTERKDVICFLHAKGQDRLWQFTAPFSAHLQVLDV